jgi:hypothetical protein
LDIRIDKRSLSSSHIRDRRASYTPLQALRQDETRDLPGDLNPSHPFAKPAQRFLEVSRIDTARDGKPYIRRDDVEIAVSVAASRVSPLHVSLADPRRALPIARARSIMFRRYSGIRAHVLNSAAQGALVCLNKSWSSASWGRISGSSDRRKMCTDYRNQTENILQLKCTATQNTGIQAANANGSARRVARVRSDEPYYIELRRECML